MTFQTVFFNSGSILTVRFYFFQDNFRFIRPKRKRCGTQQAGCKHLHRATYSKFKLFAPFFRGHCCDVMQLQIMRHMQWLASIILKKPKRSFHPWNNLTNNVPLFKKLRDIIFFWWENHFMSHF